MGAGFQMEDQKGIKLSITEFVTIMLAGPENPKALLSALASQRLGASGLTRTLCNAHWQAFALALLWKSEPTSEQIIA